MLGSFNTGFCTLWWDGVWAQCCEVHDIAYAAGVDKFQADLGLGICVAQTGHFWMGVVMFLGVSIFGYFFYNRKKKTDTK
jgi:LPXTG-motif cell wall-anchored protein